MQPESLGVIGLGAIGGSVAWHAARAGVPRVLGFSVPPGDAIAAAKAGAITEVVSTPEQVVDRADLVVLATPPGAALRLIDQLASRLRARGCLATDVCSVKASILDRATARGLGESFAGSHPFAGTHDSGFTAARPDLFHRRVVYVTATDSGEAAALEVADFWDRVIGADVVRTSAGRHDELLAWTSHLPQAAASALAVALAEHLPTGTTLGAGARDTTRLAASSVEMWTDILLLNREHVIRALEAYGRAAGDLRAALEATDQARVAEWLERGRTWRSRAGD